MTNKTPTMDSSKTLSKMEFHTTENKHLEPENTPFKEKEKHRHTQTTTFWCSTCWSSRGHNPRLPISQANFIGVILEMQFCGNDCVSLGIYHLQLRRVLFEILSFCGWTTRISMTARHTLLCRFGRPSSMESTVLPSSPTTSQPVGKCKNVHN